MAKRHEEKYIISYRQYALMLKRASELLTPDKNGLDGSYVISSLYFDDPMDTALYEKLDGLPEHRKFRARTYNFSPSLIKLERKDKHGIITDKNSASISRAQLELLQQRDPDLSGFTGNAYDLVSQMEAAGLAPAVIVRYRRDAFMYAGGDFRLTFDTEMEAIPARSDLLFSPDAYGVPVLDRNSVIMEIKYGDYIPAFARKMCSLDCTQLSVSKYALCRQKFLI